MNIQGWFPLGLTDLISFQSLKRLLRVFSRTTIPKHQFFSTQPSLWSNSHNYMKKILRYFISCFNFFVLVFKIKCVWRLRAHLSLFSPLVSAQRSPVVSGCYWTPQVGRIWFLEPRLENHLAFVCFLRLTSQATFFFFYILTWLFFKFKFILHYSWFTILCFRCTSKWVIHTHIAILFQFFFPISAISEY